LVVQFHSNIIKEAYHPACRSAIGTQAGSHQSAAGGQTQREAVAENYAAPHSTLFMIECGVERTQFEVALICVTIAFANE